jgi:hypothetical protein
MKYCVLLIFCVLGLNANGQIPNCVPTNGLAGWWPFNGNAIDESGNGNDASVFGATLTEDRNGAFNSAMHFGGNAKIVIQGGNGIPLSNSPHTFAFWMKSSSVMPPLNRDIFGWVNYAQSERFGFATDDDNAYFVGHWNDIMTQHPLHDEDWHQVVVSYDGAIVKMYSDGVLVGSGQKTLNTTNDTCVFGSSPLNNTSPVFFEGELDDVAVWNRVLSQTEIFNQYNAAVSGNSDFILNGSATWISTDCLALTQSDVYEVASVWSQSPINLNNDFEISFNLNLGQNDAMGGDGVCFVLHGIGAQTIGESGGGMGYLNLGPSIGIEFDTWQNGEYGDPAFDHTALIYNGSVLHSSSLSGSLPVALVANNANAEDGQFHQVSIKWNAILKLFSVYFDCNQLLEIGLDIPAVIFNNNSSVFWGFTGSTGGVTNVQSICGMEVTYPPANSAQLCIGQSAVLGSSLLGSSVSWSPQMFLDNPNSATPICTPLTDIIYEVDYVNSCGESTTQIFEVDVLEPLPVDIFTEYSTICDGDTILISSNITNGNEYLWQLNGNETLNGVDSSIEISEAGMYSLTIIDNQGCSSSDTLSIQVVSVPTPTIVPSINYVYTGTNTSFGINAADGSTNYQWQTNPLNTGWINVPNNTTYAGATINTLSINNISVRNHLQPFQVTVSNGSCEGTSPEAYIFIIDTCVNNLTVYDTAYISVTDTLIIDVTLTGLEEPNDEITIQIYPNPTSDHITINYGDFIGLNGYTLSIFNPVGQLVHTSNITQQQEYLDLNTWGGVGVYNVVVYNPQGGIVSTKQIVLQ